MNFNLLSLNSRQHYLGSTKYFNSLVTQLLVYFGMKLIRRSNLICNLSSFWTIDPQSRLNFLENMPDILKPKILMSKGV